MSAYEAVSKNATSKHVVIIGGGVSGQDVAKKVLKLSNTRVTIVQCNEFTEFPVFAPYHISRPDFFVERANTPLGAIKSLEHLAIDDVEYVVGTVSGLSEDKKQIVFKDGRSLSFDALVVASGIHYPILAAEPGETYEQRVEFVKGFSSTVVAAKSILLGGTGPVGLEVVMELRRLNPNAKIQMVTSAKQVLGWDGAAAKHLQDRLDFCKIEVIKEARVQDVNPAKAVLTRANYQLSNGTLINDVDVFIPYFGVARTEFLPANFVDGSTRNRLRIKNTGQAIAQDNIYAVGTGNLYTNSFVDNLFLESTTVVKNIALQFDGKQCSETLPETAPEPVAFYAHLGIGQFNIMNVDLKGCMFGFCGRFCGCCNPVCPCCACCGWPGQFPASECAGKCFEILLIDNLKDPNFHQPKAPVMAEMSR